jgi:hypothetical protein
LRRVEVTSSEMFTDILYCSYIKLKPIMQIADVQVL